jgi:hypothetical protein
MKNTTSVDPCPTAEYFHWASVSAQIGTQQWKLLPVFLETLFDQVLIVLVLDSVMDVETTDLS